jgi:transcriptional regulator with XRE-family HTH domain
MLYYTNIATLVWYTNMSEKKFIAGLTKDALDQLSTLGENIRQARIARQFSQEALAARSLMSKATYIRVENGDPSASMGAYLAVLDLLDLLNGLQDIAAPHKDEIGRRYRSLKGRRKSAHV